jgi:hypothetical protein
MRVRSRIGGVLGLVALLMTLAARPVLADEVALAGVTHRYDAFPAWGADSVLATATQSGRRDWLFGIENHSSSTIVNPTITVNSGYPAGTFNDCTGNLVTTPVVFSQPALVSQGMGGGFCSSIPVNFNSGFDATRSTVPVDVPVGGGRQTLTVTMTLQDTRYAVGNVVTMQVFANDIPGEAIDCTTVSTSQPGNGQLGCSSNQMFWATVNQAVGVRLQLTMAIAVPNSSARPFLHEPGIYFDGAVNQPPVLNGPTSAGLTISDQLLDGVSQNAGSAHYSVDNTSLTWASSVNDDFFLNFGPVTKTVDLNVTLTVNPSVATNGTRVVANGSITNTAPVSRQVTAAISLYFNNSLLGSITFSQTLAAGQTIQRQFAFTVTSSMPRGLYTVVATATDIIGTGVSKASLNVI